MQDQHIAMDTSEITIAKGSYGEIVATKDTIFVRLHTEHQRGMAFGRPICTSPSSSHRHWPITADQIAAAFVIIGATSPNNLGSFPRGLGPDHISNAILSYPRAYIDRSSAYQ